MDETYTLLIWEKVPESVDLYLIPNSRLDTEDIYTLVQAHGYYINCTDGEADNHTALNRINNALTANVEYIDDEYRATRWGGTWAEFWQSPDRPLVNVSITRVFKCGFVL